MRAASSSLVLLPALLLWPGWAAADLAAQPGCRSALQALTAAEAASDAASSGRLAAARRQAAGACLGPAAAAAAAASAPPLGARSLPAVPALGVTVPRAAAPRPSPLPTVPPPAVAPRPPVSITSCDAAGCWASDGSRLQRVGPMLVGPRGVCAQAAGVLSCP
ncbi:MAG: hypothetical protein QM750_20635 [Rubrivivax sp.]